MRGLMALYLQEQNPSGRIAVDAVKAGDDILMLPRDLNAAYTRLWRRRAECGPIGWSAGRCNFKHQQRPRIVIPIRLLIEREAVVSFSGINRICIVIPPLLR
jgi:hypothetical protein